MHKIICLFAFLVIHQAFCQRLLAQSSYAQNLPPNYSIQETSSLNFSSGNINSVVQDKEGFIWFGSWEGLFMYDGYSLRTYKARHGYSDCFRGRKVRVVYSDSDGRLWVGSNLQGLHLFDRNSQCFIQFKHEDGNSLSIPENDIMGIWEDSKKNIWMATTYGFVSKVNLNDNGTATFDNYEFEKEGIDFLSISKVKNDIIWIGTNRGLVRFDMSNPAASQGKANFTYYDKGIFARAFDAVYVAQSSETDVRLLLGSADGLYEVVFENHELLRSTPIMVDVDLPSSLKNKINAVYQGIVDSTTLWIGTDDGAFAFQVFEKKFTRLFVEAPGFNNKIEKVNEFFEDNSGVVWIGTNKGLQKIDKYGKSFHFIDMAPHQGDQASEIRSLMKSEHGMVYIGTYGSGIVEASRMISDYQYLPFNQDDISLKFVNTLLVDQNKYIWVGTDGSGMYVVDGNSQAKSKNRIAAKFNKSGGSVSDDYFVSSLADGDHNLWFGTYQGGLNLFDGDGKGFIVIDQIGKDQWLSSSPIVKLYEDKRANLWVGTRGNGIFKFAIRELKKGKAGNFTHYSNGSDSDRFLPDNFITDMCEDSRGRLWIGTESGLCLLNIPDHSTNFYTTANGFPGELVQSIVAIKEDELWLSTKKSIVKTLIKGDGEDIDMSFQEYNYSEGLGNRFFHNNAVITLGDTVIFGGSDGLTLFSPDDIRSNPYKPKVVITDLLLNYESVPVGKFKGREAILEKSIGQTSEITLKHFDNNITIEFAALHFAAPEKNKYKFKMEGFDDDWIMTTASRRFAHYSNLDAGTYLFKVSGSNNDGVWTNNSKVLKITVLPPFWLTVWAYFLYALITIGMFWLIRKITLSRIKLRHSIEIERLERERADELHNLELQYFTNISHEIRTPLTLILGPLEKLLNTTDLNGRMLNQLQLMQHHGQRLYRLLNQLMDFRKLGKEKVKLKAAQGDIVSFLREIFISFREEAKDRNIDYNFDTKQETIKLYFDRDLMEKILYNLLSNAFKYSRNEGEISILISFAESAQVRSECAQTISVYDEIYPLDYLKISVKDTGQGISEGSLNKVFNWYFREESAIEKTKVGTGIGLALTKDLVLLHKGAITVESKLGQGSVFSVFIPTGIFHLYEDEILSDFIDGEGSVDYTNQSSSVPQVGLKREVNEVDSEKDHVLVIEDNSDVRNFVRDILSLNFQISEAADGMEGLGKIKAEIPDLVISDVMMPEMDGLELCSRVKKDPVTSHIPVVLLTARTSLIFKVEGIETGADDYITKPFSPDYLLARVKNLIDQRKALKRKFSEKLYVKPKEITLNSLDEDFLNKLMEVVEEKMSDSHFGIEEICEDIGMSKMQLYRKLKALTGLSANEFLRVQRIQRAAQLLKQGQLTVAQITYEVGFNDLKYFRSRFTEHFKMTPSEYAKKSKANEGA